MLVPDIDVGRLSLIICWNYVYSKTLKVFTELPHLPYWTYRSVTTIAPSLKPILKWNSTVVTTTYFICIHIC